MNIFRPSPAFQAFFNAVIATGEGAVTPGIYAPAIPTFSNPRETFFTERVLVPFIATINLMKASVAPAVVTRTQEVLVYMQYGMTLEEAEMQANVVATMSTP